MPRRLAFALCLALASTVPAAAPDAEAGRALAAKVCAACHGANGWSVGDDFPHLAGQRAAYLEAQLKALKDGTRKDDTMGPIAAQLSAADIANLAAHFSRQPGAKPDSSSPAPEAFMKTRVAFPKDFPAGFMKYRTVERAEANRMTINYANRAAFEAAREGRALPEGSVIAVAGYSAKRGADGKLEPDRLQSLTLMASATGWGEDFPAMLRNGNWQYAAYTGEGKANRVNQAPCLACHKVLEAKSHVFTLGTIAEAAKR